MVGRVCCAMEHPMCWHSCMVQPTPAAIHPWGRRCSTLLEGGRLRLRASVIQRYSSTSVCTVCLLLLTFIIFFLFVLVNLPDLAKQM